MSVQSLIDASASKRIMSGLMAEARAIVTGASFEVAARVGSDIASAGKPRECAPRLTDDRTHAVNGDVIVGPEGQHTYKRNPWNARGLAAPGSNSQRSKDGNRQRARSVANAHAGTQDKIKRDMHTLCTLVGYIDAAKGRTARRAHATAAHAVANRIMANRGMLLDTGRKAGANG